MEGRKDERISGGIWKATELLLSFFLALRHRQETRTCVMLTLPVHCPKCAALLFVHSVTLYLTHSNPKSIPAHPPFQLRPGPQISGCKRVGVFKCAGFWVSATSVCADPQATSCMKSPALRKHPSQRRLGLTLYRKLSGLRAFTHSPCIINNISLFCKTIPSVCFPIILYSFYIIH